MIIKPILYALIIITQWDINRNNKVCLKFEIFIYIFSKELLLW